MTEEDYEFNSKFDKLGLEPFSTKLMQLIKDFKLINKDKGLVISLDSSWGTGKTTFLKMLQRKINKQNSMYKLIYYNAWENDDFENALIPLLYCLKKEGFAKGDKLTKLILKGTAMTAKNLASSISFSLPFISFSSKGLVKSIEDIIKLHNENNDFTKQPLFENYEKYIDDKRDFIDTLNSLPVFENDVVVILMDELDRCRPLFAIETLEVIKHFFNIKNIVFLLAMDVSQLSHSIATLYGQNMDAAGYLRRFFDIQTGFPHINLRYFVKQQLERELTASSSSIMLNEDEQLITYVKDISEYTLLSLRDIVNFIQYMKVLLSSSLAKYDKIDNEYDFSLIFCFYYMIIVLKYKYTSFWTKIVKKRKQNQELGFTSEERYIYNFRYVDTCPPAIPILYNILENQHLFTTVENVKARDPFLKTVAKLKLNGDTVSEKLQIFNIADKNKYMFFYEMLLDDLAFIE